MKNFMYKIIVNNKEIFAHLNVITANYSLECDIAENSNKLDEFLAHENYKSLECYIKALESGKIENFNTKLQLSRTKDEEDTPIRLVKPYYIANFGTNKHNLDKVVQFCRENDIEVETHERTYLS
ncbi:MAG: hypothetical protein AAF348_19170 [Bacteroidota bacterium]